MNISQIKPVWWIFLPILLLLAGCSSRKGLQNENIAYWYNPKELAVRPHLHIHHLTDTTTEVQFRFNSGDLLYIRAGDNNNYKASATFEYQVLPSLEKTVALDSGVIKIEDVHRAPRQIPIAGTFKLKTPPTTKKQEYLLRIIVRDNYRRAKFEHFEIIEKGDKNLAENFVLTDLQGNKLYKNHIATGAPFKIQHRNYQGARYHVGYYNRDFPLALPPYSTKKDKSFELTPDSSYTVFSNGPITLNKPGFYHFRIDTSQWQGFTVFSFYDEFPYVANRTNLAGPLRYLTTQKEYEELQSISDKPEKVKTWVDEFWRERAGSKERAKKLIKAFYRRVEFANRYFSSYLEGWKTDRGIIYIIYGPPDKVYRSSQGEGWVYGSESSTLSYMFNFLRVNNPFSENDYELNRMPNYRYGWGQAVESWRSGHIYNSRDIKREQDEQDQYRYNQRYPVWY